MATQVIHEPAREAAEVVAVNQTTMTGRRMSWGAVFAGVLAALIVHVLLNLLGIGVGVSTLPVLGEAPDTEVVTLSAGIWWALTGALAALAGGWVAGRLVNIADPGAGGLHGLLAWAGTTLFIMFFLAGFAGGIVGGAIGVFGEKVSAAMDSSAAIAEYMAQTGELSPERREATIADLEQQGLSREQATAAVDHVAALIQRAQGMAPDDPEIARKAETATRLVGSAALLTFAIMVLGAVIGALGGRWGARSLAAAVRSGEAAG